MNEISLLILEPAISVLLSITIWALLAKSLKEALLDICPTAKQASFWLAYTKTMLLISPLLLVLFFNKSHKGILVSDLRSAFIATLAGLLIALIIIGKKMYIPVDRQVKKSAKELS